jgi:hypothetical protein
MISTTYLPALLQKRDPDSQDGLWNKTDSALQKGIVGLNLVRFLVRVYTRTLISELRSLFGRMKILHDKNWHIEIGQAWELDPSGHLVSSKRFHARTSDIQKLRTSHPQASLGDLEIFFQGWDMGETFCKEQAYKEDFCN